MVRFAPEKIKMKKQKIIKETQKDKTPCSMCYGYGWHPIGNLCPIGQMDAEEWGDKVIKCPWCGKGFVENDKYDYLLKHKENQVKINKLKGG